MDQLRNAPSIKNVVVVVVVAAAFVACVPLAAFAAFVAFCCDPLMDCLVGQLAGWLVS